MTVSPGFYGGRYIDESEIEDARREEIDAALGDHLLRCWNCDCEWDEGYHRATRTDPAYVDQSECPRCGCHPDEREEQS